MRIVVILSFKQLLEKIIPIFRRGFRLLKGAYFSRGKSPHDLRQFGSLGVTKVKMFICPHQTAELTSQQVLQSHRDLLRGNNKTVQSLPLKNGNLGLKRVLRW